MDKITIGHIKLFILIFLLTSCNPPDSRDKEIARLKLQCSDLNSTGATLLYGEDGSGWFKLTKESCLNNGQYRITSFYEDCSKEWDAIFTLKSGENLDPSSPYEFIPISDYEKCLIKQTDKIFTLTCVRDFTECK